MKDKTLEYYNENAEQFFQDTVEADMSHLYGRFLQKIPAGGRILDLGCGSGRDSRQFLDRGFRVTAVDGSAALCQLAERHIGQEVLCMDFGEMAFEECFDGVWACASLLHVPRDSIKGILARVSDALVPGGVLYACFKAGTGERNSGGRFFCDYSMGDMDRLFAPEDGWELCETFLTGDVREDREDQQWVNV
ncbi:MAG: class I SAM-dependent methyltransferase, partial [Emergencia sp.]